MSSCDALMRRLTSAVAPARCAGCDSACDGAAALCAECRESLLSGRGLVEAGPPGVDLSVSAAEYRGAARRVAHGLKFGRRLVLARVAAEAMVAACPAGEPRGTVVPVPASPLRGRWRGFDPAEEIAIAVAQCTGLPYRRCLRRRPGPRQVGRPRSERLARPPRVKVGRRGAPHEVLLVDDVHTTGATLGACAAALRAAGCARVVALTLARSRSGEPRSRPRRRARYGSGPLAGA